jgi:Sigma-70 region 2
MPRGPTHRVIKQVHRLFSFGAAGALSDAQLLERFAAHGDEAAEAAFEELVTRHGPMVLRVCHGVLRDSHDAEDAFQAVFLVLANRARSIHKTRSVAS